jgi:uncharacterized membrane protein YfcA
VAAEGSSQRSLERSLKLMTIGTAAGLLSGLFGIGGGIVIVPALVLLAGMPALTATGTSLGALLLPVGALGAWTYYRNGHLDVRAAALVAAGLASGVVFGALYAQGLAPAVLKRAFAVFLVVVALRMWFAGGK